MRDRIDGAIKSSNVRDLNEFSMHLPYLLEQKLPQVINQVAMMRIQGITDRIMDGAQTGVNEGMDEIPDLNTLIAPSNYMPIGKYQLDKSLAFHNRLNRYKQQAIIRAYHQRRPQYNVHDRKGRTDSRNIPSIKSPSWFSNLEERLQVRKYFKQNHVQLKYNLRSKFHPVIIHKP
jgi:hypothetical protein